VSVRDDEVLLEVRDDGQGLAAAALGKGGDSAGPTGFGLSGMRERAELLGGKLQLSSSPGRGTTVRLVLPLSPAGQAV
jgi:signal transduction histidine kinase